MTLDLADAVRSSHGFDITSVQPVAAGVNTRNYTAHSQAHGRVFLKVYPPSAALDDQQAAIELGEFAAAGSVPTAPLIRDPAGHPIATCGGLAYSVWTYLDAPSGELLGLNTAQLQHMGTLLGHLHRHLTNHPASLANPGGRAAPPDLSPTADKLSQLRGRLRTWEADPWRRWARHTLEQRIDLLPRIEAVLAAQPDYTAQVGHGDLAAPNVLLHPGGQQVAAVIDYQPPRAVAIAHDVSRIGCDPRTVIGLGARWPAALAGLARAYVHAHPDVDHADVIGAVRWWLAYTAASTYPLGTLVRGESATDGALADYARHRHTALLTVLARRAEVEDAVAAAVDSLPR